MPIASKLLRTLFVPTAIALACASANASLIAQELNVFSTGGNTYENRIKVYTSSAQVGAACRADLATYGFDPDRYCTEASNIYVGYLQDPSIAEFFYSFYWQWCPLSTDFDPTSGYCKPFKLNNKTLEPCNTCGAQGDASTPSFGNPIQPLRGAKTETVSTGMTVGGMELTLHYDSIKQVIAAAEGRDVFSWSALPSIGPLWSTNLHRKLQVNARDIQAYRGAGNIISFPLASGSYVPGDNIRDRLVPVGTDFKYTDALTGAVETYDQYGQLLTIAPISGGLLSYVYSTTSTPSTIAPAPYYLIGIQDNFGRSISFAYTLPSGGEALTDGKITSITDSSGRVLASAYDSKSNLTTLTWPDGTTNQFLYENPNFPMALTGIVNGTGTRRSTFAYDTGGIATSTSMAGGTLGYSVAYTTPPAVQMTKVYDSTLNVLFRDESWVAPTGTVVTLPNGSVTSLSSTNVLGANIVTSTSQAAGSGSAASTSTTAYNAHGKQIQRDDYRGVRWCADYDMSRDLPTVKVDGLPSTSACSSVLPTSSTLPAGSFKSTTSWHPNWSLPVKVFEPLMVTTHVYNGQPDPFAGGATASCVVPADLTLVVECKKVEQATLDTDGHLGAAATLDTTVADRVWRNTFDPNGQPLTVRGPRTDLDDTSTLAYFTSTSFTGTDPNAVGHRTGDLNTITDAEGQVTTFLTYNKNGQLLSMTDPNGVSSAFTRDARDRVIAIDVGGETTTLSYTLNGQLYQVNDGSTTLTFEYDAALRRTAVADNLSNRIEYTLDNFGSPVVDNAKDPSGSLARALTRVMDALGRAQSAAGALGQE